MADDSYMPSLEEFEAILEGEPQGPPWPGREPNFGAFPPELAEWIAPWLAQFQDYLPADGGDHREFISRFVMCGSNWLWCVQYAALHFGMTANGSPWQRNEEF